MDEFAGGKLNRNAGDRNLIVRNTLGGNQTAGETDQKGRDSDTVRKTEPIEI